MPERGIYKDDIATDSDAAIVALPKGEYMGSSKQKTDIDLFEHSALLTIICGC
jgi:hypothetical protein